MSELLALKTYSEFELHPVFGVYCCQLESHFMLTPGETYTVIWDDAEYTCTTQDTSAQMGVESAVLGNATPFGLSGNNEPFIFLTFAEKTEYPLIAALLDTAPGGTHSFGLFGSGESGGDDSDPVVLKDRNGGDLLFSGVETVRLQTSSGNTKTFISGDPVEATVEPDFSSGNMEVLPELGKLFSKLTISKPENLSPENIAEGVNIAGIVGALTGGGAELKVKCGTFPKDSTSGFTITHNFGVIPDLVLIATNVVTSYSVNMSVSLSTKFADRVGFPSSYRCVSALSDSSGKYKYAYGSQGLEGSYKNAGLAYGGTDTSVIVHSTSSYYLRANTVFLVIGGLT